MDPARPIERNDQDEFERLEFVTHLAGFLCLGKDEPSIVVGIEGRWGEGKTSCINLVKEILNKNPSRPIIVDYQPWLIATLDSVIEGFFIELASALGTQSRAQNATTAAHKVLQFGKMLAPIKLIPGVEPWGSMVESVLSAVGNSVKAGAELANLSLKTRKEDLQQYLKRINRPIVVVIDDVDRLSPENVRIVFQMLKAVCDFDRVSYLVAYDPQPIKDALSYDGIYDGKKYLEKIVQISYRLPRLSFTHMKDYVKRNMQLLEHQCSIELEGTEKKLFEVLLNRTDLIRVLETPRDVIRLCNRLRLSSPNTRNEVSFSDLVAFETMELMFPELSNIIRTEPDLFLEGIGMDAEFFTDTVATYYTAFSKAIKAKEKKEQQDPITSLLNRVNYTERKNDAVMSLLIFMFPHLANEKYSKNNIPNTINRVRNRDALLKLLHCGPTSFTYSSKQVQRFYNNPDERHQILAQYIDANDLSGWITYLGQFMESLADNLQNPVGVCDVILEETQRLDLQGSNQILLRQLGIFLNEMIKSQKDEEIRHEMLFKLVSNVTSLALSEHTLLHFLIEYGIWKEGKYIADQSVAETLKITHLDLFSYDELYAAKDCWLSKVRESVESQDFLETQQDVISIFFRWGQLNNNDFSEVQAYVMKNSADSQWLQKYLLLFDNDVTLQYLLIFIPEESYDNFIQLTTALSQHDEHATTIIAFLQQVLEAKQNEMKELTTNRKMT